MADTEVLKTLVLKVGGVGNCEVVTKTNQHPRDTFVLHGFCNNLDVTIASNCFGIDG
ncbi:hypothetical protein D3C71_2081570 [compost metagenome]